MIMRKPWRSKGIAPLLGILSSMAVESRDVMAAKARLTHAISKQAALIHALKLAKQTALGRPLPHPLGNDPQLVEILAHSLEQVAHHFTKSSGDLTEQEFKHLAEKRLLQVRDIVVRDASKTVVALDLFRRIERIPRNLEAEVAQGTPSPEFYPIPVLAHAFSGVDMKKVPIGRFVSAFTETHDLISLPLQELREKILEAANGPLSEADNQRLADLLEHENLLISVKIPRLVRRNHYIDLQSPVPIERLPKP